MLLIHVVSGNVYFVVMYIGDFQRCCQALTLHALCKIRKTQNTSVTNLVNNKIMYGDNEYLQVCIYVLCGHWQVDSKSTNKLNAKYSRIHINIIILIAECQRLSAFGCANQWMFQFCFKYQISCIYLYLFSRMEPKNIQFYYYIDVVG